MNAITPQSQMPTAAARLVQAIINWFPKAEPSADWTKQATITLAVYPLDVLKAIHQRGQLEFRGFPSIPALAQLANRVAGDLHPKQENDADHPWLQWDRKAQELAQEAHKLSGLPSFYPGYADTLMSLTNLAYVAIKANWERKGRADCPKVPTAIDLVAQIDGRYQPSA